VGGTTLLAGVLIVGLILGQGTGRVGTPSARPPTPTVRAEPAAPPKPPCTTATHRFVPTAVTIPGVAGEVPVVPMHRDAHGIPGVPPLSRRGKAEMAFDLDNAVRPGDPHGNALLNAHTWPDGSALGNKLLTRLHKGDRIIVRGSEGRICYQVADRVQVPATDPGKRYYAKGGPPQVAIVVCSGRRLGPGEWTKRTLWFASLVR
jgi:hypothetical protein